MAQRVVVTFFAADGVTQVGQPETYAVAPNATSDVLAKDLREGGHGSGRLRQNGVFLGTGVEVQAGQCDYVLAQAASTTAATGLSPSPTFNEVAQLRAEVRGQLQEQGEQLQDLRDAISAVPTKQQAALRALVMAGVTVGAAGGDFLAGGRARWPWATMGVALGLKVLPSVLLALPLPEPWRLKAWNVLAWALSV